MQEKAATLTLRHTLTAGQAIVTASLVRDGEAVLNETVKFFVDGEAVFTESGNQSATAITNQFGQCSVHVTDSVSQTVTVTATALGAAADTVLDFTTGITTYTRPHLREATGSGGTVSLSTSGLGATVNVDVNLSANATIVAGDQIALQWLTTNASGAPGSTYTATHNVTAADVSTGTASFAVPTAQYVTPYSGGNLTLSYTVKDGSTGNPKGKESDKETVLVNAQASLVAPNILEVSGDTIPADIPTVTLRIPAWTGMATGQTVTYSWVGKTVGGSNTTLTDSIPVTALTLNQPIDFTLSASTAVVPFDGGTVDISYTVSGVGTSGVHHYSVGAQQMLPAPVVNEAVDGTITPNTNATVTVRYPGMTAGDAISLLWQSYSASGSAETPYSPATHTVTSKEAAAGVVTLTVPSQYVAPDKGRVEVSYRELVSGRSSAVAQYTIGAAAGNGKVTSFEIELPSNGGPVSGDGLSYYQLKATVTDDAGQPVNNATVTFSGSIPNGRGFNLSQSTVQTDPSGEARTHVTCTEPATVLILARGGVNDAGKTLILTFEALISGTTSTFTAQPDGIVADGKDTTTLTLTAKSAEGELMTGLANRLVFNLSGGSGQLSAITETPANSGIYTAQLSSHAAGTLNVTPLLDGKPVGSLTASVVMSEGMSALVNGYTFTTDSGFPTTGFAQAKFQLLINGSASNNSNYTWSCDQTWLTVDSGGNVTFLRKPDSSEKMVRILARSRTGGGGDYAYKFTLNSWFINNGSTVLNWSGANAWAAQQMGVQPSYTELSNGSINSGSIDVNRTTGRLWCEWGNMGLYANAGFSGNYYWTSEANGSSSRTYVNLNTGLVYSYSDKDTHYVVCRLSL